ncbi:MAG: hypothetical protein LQ345_007202 [Seirophora villosa]|nr:MAG: hypothetical protein LQ345_007202 [Seirophora villosa]
MFIHLLSFPLLSFSLLLLAIAAGSGLTAHLPDQPGNVQNDDDVCPSYERCKSAGFRLWKTLRDTLADPSHVDRADGKPIYDAYYLSETIPLGTYGSGVRPDLQEHGINWQKMTLWASTSKDPETGEEAFDSAYGNILDTANGVVIAIENTRDYDKSRKLNWSEIIYQTWQRAMLLETEYAAAKKPGWVPGVNLSSFKHSIQTKIANPETQKIIERAYRDLKYPMPAAGEKGWRRWTLTKTPDWFYALLGTDNCKGTVWMLNDHAAEAGGKIVKDIWTRWGEVYPDIWYVLISV